MLEQITRREWNEIARENKIDGSRLSTWRYTQLVGAAAGACGSGKIDGTGQNCVFVDGVWHIAFYYHGITGWKHDVNLQNQEEKTACCSGTRIPALGIDAMPDGIVFQWGVQWRWRDGDCYFLRQYASDSADSH